MNIIYITVIPYEISGKKQKLKLNVKKNTLPTERALPEKIRATIYRI